MNTIDITTAPRVYVGTFAKYSNGNLEGCWVNLNEFDNAEDFKAKCLEIHSDAECLEIMIQDWENIPEGLVGTYGVSEMIWEWVQMDGIEKDQFQAFCEVFPSDISIENFENWTRGFAETFSEWCEEEAYERFPHLNTHAVGPTYFDWGSFEIDMDIEYSHAVVNGLCFVFQAVSK